MLPEGPIRRMLHERGLLKKFQQQRRDIRLAVPVKVGDWTLKNMQDVDAFRALYGSVISLYDDLNSKCSETHQPLFCIQSHILGPFAREMMRAVEKLREQAVW